MFWISLIASLMVYYWFFGGVGGVLVVGGLMAHALGHAVLASRFGVKTTIRLIPPFGVIEILDRDPPDGFAHAAIATAGPAAGLAFVLVAYVSIHAFGLEECMLPIAFLMCMNVANLLPIYPLDGGRLVAGALAALQERYAGSS